MEVKVSKPDSKGTILAGPHLTSYNPLPVGERWLGARGRQELGREKKGGQGKESKPRWRNDDVSVLGTLGSHGKLKKPNTTSRRSKKRNGKRISQMIANNECGPCPACPALPALPSPAARLATQPRPGTSFSCRLGGE